MNPFGVRGAWLRRQQPPDELVTTARGLEELGYDTVWISGGGEPGIFDILEAVLDGTERILVAPGIVNIWVETPESVTDGWHRLEERHPGRLYVGLGISHGRLVEGMGLDYSRPVATTRAFLDGLDAQTDPLPVDRRIVAALGPKMLRLAAERSLGTHPYLTTVDNTVAARAGVGPGKVVATELGVVLEPDLAAARAQGKEAIAYYLGLPNYTNNWRRAGFTDEDLGDGTPATVSDRLVDALLGLGDAAAVSERIRAHRDAGADHVCVQVLGSAPDPLAVFAALKDA
ncbi:TIGR03620 family F420-dependent LLM class oxidoreductase [Nocardioides sp. KR10-350]|uniref:TIGR03620 family F420-dependent LLM class oxidoreductase n=1 Tax=Nocardioides cheoyonin TaxID=3156615 RepID=UPI0032B4E70C